MIEKLNASYSRRMEAMGEASTIIQAAKRAANGWLMP
jgi:hypothetical protein